MGDDNKYSNVIRLCDRLEKNIPQEEPTPGSSDAGEFIVDMLDVLLRFASREDQPLLNYLLAMARTEAQEMVKQKDE